MGLIYRYALPRFVERGVQIRINAQVLDEDTEVEQTVASGTIDIYNGSTAVVDGGALLSLGSPSVYTLAAATTTDVSLSARWQERWNLTIGTDPHVFIRPIYVVRFIPRSVIVDADLFTRHRQLSRLRDRDDTNYSPQRAEAFTWIERRLINAGNRPELLLDNSELREAHIFKSLHIIYRDHAASVNSDQRYVDLADEYEQKAIREFDSIHLTYDTDNDGIDGEEYKRNPTSIILTNRPPRWRY
jgi:hypothetical protein